MSSNPWMQLKGPGYRIQHLGQPVMFLIPAEKLALPLEGGTVESVLHDFLAEGHGAYTTMMVPFSGVCQNDKAQLVYDECRMYEVSFDGNEHMRELLARLASICAAINEECLYVKIGQHAARVYPA